ncbi:toll/interleukin-1 receptor domain-containing protein [Burkholderia pseudomultivorans]|nr:toll/interleukin-1 receptor domain-containing protein [Burkholderia pseudomultivorans]
MVEHFAVRLRDIFPQDEIFYDSWSIQPGDGIVARMSEGLADCKLFLFFVSKNSLASKMVELEWQNAVIKATQGKTKIVPVKVDDCMMPPILLQTLYIDLFGQGLDVALRQVLDVAQGNNTFKAGPQEFNNIRAYAYEKDDSIIVECQAAHFLEPMSHYVIVVDNKEEDISFKCTSDTMCIQGFNSNVAMNDGSFINGILIGVDRGTTPAFPVVTSLTSRNGQQVRVSGVLHKKSLTEWRYVPFALGPART